MGIKTGATDGVLGRQLADCLGDDMVGLLRRTSASDYWPRLIGYKDRLMPPVLAHRGEFLTPQKAASQSRKHPEVAAQFLPMLAGGAGFTSLSDLISEVTTAGKGQPMLFSGKVGSTQATTGISETLWNSSGMPGAGANPAALAAGTLPTNATAGSLQQTDPAGGDGLYLVSANAWCNVSPSILILYDRLWHGAVAMNSTGNQTVTYTAARYATTTSPGNVIVPEIRTVLPATAHNNTVLYTNQAGTASQSTGAIAGISSGAAQRLDFNVAGTWNMALAAGDTGVQKITQYTCSAAVASGQIDLVHGRPLCFIPCPLVGLPGYVDGINSAFNLTQVLAGACLAFWNIKGAATASATYSGQVFLASG